jgi:hypothetical protein
MEDYTTLIAEANKELTRKHDHPDQWALERLLCAMTGACEELQRELVSLQQVLDSVDRGPLETLLRGPERTLLRFSNPPAYKDRGAG